MAESNSSNESNTNTFGLSPENLKLVEQRMIEVDAKIPSPQQRAEKILALVRANPNDLPTVWDVVCFASEYIGSQVATLPFLEDNAKELLMLVYAFHYEYPATIDPTYPKDDESNSGSSETEASVDAGGNNKRA